MFYFEVFEGFQRTGLRYLVVGGLAVNLHGVPRTTMDLDVIIALDGENVRKLFQAMEELGYLPRLPLDEQALSDPEKRRILVADKNMKAFSFYHRDDEFKVVDVVIDHPLDFAAAEIRKNTSVVKGIEIAFVCMDDLIAMKKASGRSADLSDIDMLRECEEIGYEEK